MPVAKSPSLPLPYAERPEGIEAALLDERPERKQRLTSEVGGSKFKMRLDGIVYHKLRFILLPDGHSPSSVVGRSRAL